MGSVPRVILVARSNLCSFPSAQSVELSWLLLVYHALVDFIIILDYVSYTS